MNTELMKAPLGIAEDSPAKLFVLQAPNGKYACWVGRDRNGSALVAFENEQAAILWDAACVYRNSDLKCEPDARAFDAVLDTAKNRPGVDHVWIVDTGEKVWVR